MVRTGVFISTGNIYVDMSWKHQQKNFIQATFRWIREHITHININNYKIFPINTSVSVTGLFTPAQVTLLASHFVNLECCYKVFMCMVQLEAWLNTQRSQALVALVAGFLPCLFHLISDGFQSLSLCDRIPYTSTSNVSLFAGAHYPHGKCCPCSLMMGLDAVLGLPIGLEHIPGTWALFTDCKSSQTSFYGTHSVTSVF